MEHVVLLLLFQVFLIFLNAVFAGAEIAVLSISETKLEKMSEEGNRRAKRLFSLTKQPAKFLATIQVAITLSGFLGSAFAADNFSGSLAALLKKTGWPVSDATWNAISVVLITLVLSFFTLIFGELVPKRLAMKKSEKIAMGISGLVYAISVLFKPLVALLSASTNLVLRLFGIDPNENEEEVSEEDIKMMVDVGSENGTIDHQEKEFIQNVFEFNDITAGDLATHRTDLVVLWANESDEEWGETIHKSRFTLYPICEESADNVVGILNTKDYFRLNDRSRETVMRDAVHAPFFVPEFMKADVLFRNMKATHNSMAVVLDEYGGMEGIVTLNDLIEELVGDLNEETEAQSDSEPSVEIVSDNQWILHGNVELEEFREKTGEEIDSEEYDTFTGIVFSQIGIIPDDGESQIKVDIDGYEILVTSILSHQIDRAVVTKIEVPEEVSEE